MTKRYSDFFWYIIDIQSPKHGDYFKPYWGKPALIRKVLCTMTPLVNSLCLCTARLNGKKNITTTRHQFNEAPQESKKSRITQLVNQTNLLWNFFPRQWVKATWLNLESGPEAELLLNDCFHQRCSYGLRKVTEREQQFTIIDFKGVANQTLNSEQWLKIERS